MNDDSPALPRHDGADHADHTAQSASPATDPKLAMETLAGATVDLGRGARCGFGEVIFGEGKPADLIIRIIQTQLAAGQTSLVTRISKEIADQVCPALPCTLYQPDARTLRAASGPMGPDPIPTDDQPHVAVVTAGSTDQPVAEEAAQTLGWMGIPYRRFTDIGVAGPQRLAAAAEQLRQASALVVVAGMEGALPSVVGGYVSAPIFAVPTSVGYGANLGGMTALLGMLTSCAAGVAVVNIDAGFKGAYMAGLVVRQLCEAKQ